MDTEDLDFLKEVRVLNGDSCVLRSLLPKAEQLRDTCWILPRKPAETAGDKTGESQALLRVALVLLVGELGQYS